MDEAIFTPSLAAAFVIGLFGAVHCFAMCGGIIASLSLSTQRQASTWRQLPLLLGYHLGRILGYSLMGALMGGFGQTLLSWMPLHQAQRILYAFAAVMMLLLGLYLADWYRGLRWLEQLGAHLWRRLEPVGRRWLPVRNPMTAIGIGLIWAWIPCGMVYSVLVWALASGGPLQGASLMLAFGLGTVPHLLGLGVLTGAAARVQNSLWLRRLAGLSVMALGLAALYKLLVKM